MAESSANVPMESESTHSKSIHQILGGGTVADVMLWRRRKISAGILLGTALAWILFEQSGYTLLSFVASVLLLLVVILFLWATTAAMVGRPPPPVPDFEFTDDMAQLTSSLLQSKINCLIKVARDLALGKNPMLFFKVAAWLWLISTVGSLCDFVTLAYTCLAISLTIPALYEKHAEQINFYAGTIYKKVKDLYSKFDNDVIKRLSKKFSKSKKLK